MAYSNVKGARYLLVGSFQPDYSNNKYIKVGEWMPIDLRKPPFNLTQFVRLYDETPSKKSLILYDIPNYLTKIDFSAIKSELGLK